MQTVYGSSLNLQTLNYIGITRELDSADVATTTYRENYLHRIVYFGKFVGNYISQAHYDP